MVAAGTTNYNNLREECRNVGLALGFAGANACQNTPVSSYILRITAMNQEDSSTLCWSGSFS